MSDLTLQHPELWLVLTDGGDTFDADFFLSELDALAFARGVLAKQPHPDELFIAKVKWRL